MQQLKLQGMNDPFTLLKIIQIFREIPVGEQLEIFYESAEVLDELFKVLPEGSYQVVQPSAGDEQRPGLIVLHKTAAGCDRPAAGSGCCCQ